MTTNLFQEINNRALATEAEAAGLSDRELLNGVPVWAIREAADRARAYQAHHERVEREEQARAEVARLAREDADRLAYLTNLTHEDVEQMRAAHDGASPCCSEPDTTAWWIVILLDTEKGCYSTSGFQCQRCAARTQGLADWDVAHGLKSPATIIRIPTRAQRATQAAWDAAGIGAN